MSHAIIQTAVDNRVFFRLHAHDLSQAQYKVSSEEPTRADLVFPGAGLGFSDEFACLLRVLSGGGESE